MVLHRDFILKRLDALFVDRHVARIAANPVQRGVAHHAVNPAAPSPTRCVEGGGTLPDGDESVVQHVFRILALTHDAQCHAKKVAALTRIDLRQRVTLACSAGSESGFVVEFVWSWQLLFGGTEQA